MRAIFVVLTAALAAGIAPGKDDDLGQMIMTVPKNAAKTITSYRAVLYEGGVEVGKE